jgi:transposase-like protein
MFPTRDPKASTRVMGVLDVVNAVHGRGTLRIAATGVAQTWATRQQRLSQRDTTRLQDIMRFHCELAEPPRPGTNLGMARRRRVASVRPDQSFKGRQFTAEVILWAVRWYLMFPISYRDLELMLADRGVDVAHTTLFRWTQTYAPQIEKRIRPHLRPSNGSWRVDETYVRVKGRWMYLYHAVDSRGQTIDFLLSAKRDAEAAKRFFRKALGQPHTVNPRTITVDKNPAYPCAVEQMKEDGELWRSSRLRQVKFLNNIVEQDHRRVKRLGGVDKGASQAEGRVIQGYLLDGGADVARLADG